MQTQYKEFLCVVCKSPFFKQGFKLRKQAKGKNYPIRHTKCVTCSPKCSRKYNLWRLYPSRRPEWI